MTRTTAWSIRLRERFGGIFGHLTARGRWGFGHVEKHLQLLVASTEIIERRLERKSRGKTESGGEFGALKWPEMVEKQ